MRISDWSSDVCSSDLTSSGNGADLRVNVLVKPTRSGLKTNLVITTSRRTYLLELSSTEKTWMASVSWEYPRDRMLALQRQAQAASAAAPVDTGLGLENLRFRQDRKRVASGQSASGSVYPRRRRNIQKTKTSNNKHHRKT